MELVAILCELTALRIALKLKCLWFALVLRMLWKFDKVLSCSSYWRLEENGGRRRGGGNIVPTFFKLFYKTCWIVFQLS